MNSFSLLEDIDYWKSLENDLLEMIVKSLYSLKNELKEEVEENPINFVLNRCFLKASRINIKDRYGNLSKNRQPIYEAERISYENDENRNKRMGKRPDFQWVIYDDSAPIETYSIVFTIECKRLGINPNRDLNKAYVNNGILRFVNKEWSYGEGATSGAMIGYIQNDNHKEILKKINKFCKKIPIKALTQFKNSAPIFSYTEVIERSAIEPQNFLLYHLWIDLSNTKTN